MHTLVWLQSTGLLCLIALGCNTREGLWLMKEAMIAAGTPAPCSIESCVGLATPHRREVASHAYARSVPSGLGLAERYLAGLQQASPHGGQSMEVAMQGLHQAALSGQGLQHTPFSGQDLQQAALAGQGLQQAALVQQGRNQTALAGCNAGNSFSPSTPIAHHDTLPWAPKGPSQMIQDDPAFTHPQTMTNHGLLQHMMPTGDMNQETLSTRAGYIARDPKAARGTLQWPLPMHESPSCHAYSPWPVQPTAQPQLGLHTHSQMPAQSGYGTGLEPGFQSRAQAGLSAPSEYGIGFGSSLHTSTQTQPSPLQSMADSYASRQAQAGAMDYLGHSTLAQTLPPSWQSTWPANAQTDLDASMEVDQQPTAQPDSRAAFYSW